ncbi:MAG TPA: molybdate ABC transporter substrate-binding protein [Planctomycetota bacterium]|nr:molybdate ABC transporter substrate-binding protein [Planctomycetota bacterium]
MRSLLLLLLLVAARPTPARVLVFAAASLAGPFEEIKKGHADLGIDFQFAGTPQLVAQIQQGAPADVLASADEPNMKKVVDGGLAAEAPRVFARNELQIVVEPKNPKKIASLADLARADLRVALCAAEVPAGRYAREALAKAGVKVSPVSEEPNVKALVSKVALGEIDAGIVYVTDVKAAKDKVAGVAIPPEQNVRATYPIARMRDAKNADGAKAFVELVLSEEGRKILESYGFQRP